MPSSDLMSRHLLRPTLDRSSIIASGLSVADATPPLATSTPHTASTVNMRPYRPRVRFAIPRTRSRRYRLRSTTRAPCQISRQSSCHGVSDPCQPSPHPRSSGRSTLDALRVVLACTALVAEHDQAVPGVAALPQPTCSRWMPSTEIGTTARPATVAARSSWNVSPTGGPVHTRLSVTIAYLHPSPGLPNWCTVLDED